MDELTKRTLDLATRSHQEYLAANSPGVQDIRDQVAGQEAKRKAAVTEEATNAYRGTVVEHKGPTPDRYDYTAAYSDGVDFSQGVLPNRHERAGYRMVQGYEAMTGRHTMRPAHWTYDASAEDMERAALTELQNSVRTVDGVAPDTDIPALVKFASAAMAQGAQGHEEWRAVLGDTGHTIAATQIAWEAAENAALRDDLEAYLEASINEVPDPGEVTADEPLTRPVIDPASLPSDEQWLSAARKWYEHREGEPFHGDDRALSEYALEEASAFLWNTKNMAEFTVDVLSADDPELAMAFTYLLDMYDQMPIDVLSTQRAFGNVAADPFTYVGLGVGALAFKGAKRLAARRALKPLLTRVLATAAASGSESAVMAGAEETARQSMEIEGGVREDMDLSRVGLAAGLGMGAGTVLGGTGAISPEAVAWAKKTLQKMRAGRMKP